MVSEGRIWSDGQSALKSLPDVAENHATTGKGQATQFFETEKGRVELVGSQRALEIIAPHMGESSPAYIKIRDAGSRELFLRALGCSRRIIAAAASASKATAFKSSLSSRSARAFDDHARFASGVPVLAIHLAYKGLACPLIGQLARNAGEASNLACLSRATCLLMSFKRHYATSTDNLG